MGFIALAAHSCRPPARSGAVRASSSVEMVTSLEKRWAIVFAFKSGKSVAEASRWAGVTKKVARNWLARWRASGDVQDRPRIGRPTALSEEAKRRAHHLLLNGDHGGSDGVATQLQHEGFTSTRVHRTTLASAAKSYGKQAGQPIRCLRGKPVKRLTVDTKMKRLLFASANSKNSFATTLFSDRKKFLFNYPGAKVRPTEWVQKGKQRQAAKVNHAQSLNVYAAISSHGVTAAHQVSGTSGARSKYRNKKNEAAKNITSDEYVDVLNKTLLPGGNKLFGNLGHGCWVLQQDNDPTHRVAAEVIEKWKGKRGPNITLLPNWPPNSPDLNPIENVWAMVQAKVDAMGCKSFEEFKEAVLKELRSIRPRVLSNLVKSMGKRLDLVIKSGGDRIKY